MYPFLILDLPHDATDEQVAQRYQELVKLYPPDRSPETFVAIRQAYEALKDERSRLHARLFYFDDKGVDDKEGGRPQPVGSQRKRLSSRELTELVVRINRSEITP